MTATGELDLRRDIDMRVDEGALSIVDRKVVLATPSSDVLSQLVVGLERSDYAAYWTDGKRLLLVGLRDRAVLLADPQAGILSMIGELDRLDLSGGYDPGGLEHVRFVDVSAHRVAIVFEMGIAVADLRSRTLAWQRTYDEIQTSFQGIIEGVAWFEGDHGRFGFRTDDGAFLDGAGKP